MFKNRLILRCLAATTLVAAALGAYVAFNWETVSARLAEILAVRGEQVRVTMFRWGELQSLAGLLGERYGVRPELTYETDSGERVLTIRFPANPPSPDSSTQAFARGAAAFALSNTPKADEVDAVRVLFESRADGGYRFVPQQLATIATSDPSR